MLGQWRTSADARDKERLQVILWAADGNRTLDDLARLTGRVRSTVQVWLDKFAKGGIAGLLDRDTPPGSVSPISTVKIQTQLRAGLKSGRWSSAAAVATWLSEVHGIRRSRKSLYYWINKTGECNSGAGSSPRQK